MKRKIILTVIAAMMITMTGCGKKPSDSQAESSMKPTQESSITEEKEPSDVAEQKAPTETISGDTTGVYPSATGITEVNMGITQDVCSVKVPLNYVLAGVYYDENMQKQTMKGLNSATTTVEEAMEDGSFSTGEHMAEFNMTSLDEGKTVVAAKLYSSDKRSWEAFKQHYAEAKEIESDNMQGIVYHVKTGSGTGLAIAIKINDENTLELTYIGSLESEIGEDELGQRLYNLVTVK